MILKTRRSKTLKQPTIKDVSRTAGVSTATVSRVLAGFEDVSDETRQIVLDVVASLNYQPNRNARNLRRNMTSTIGVIISDIQNPFFGSVVRGIEKITLKADLTLILGNSDEDPQRENRLISMLLEEGVAGIILVPTRAGAEDYHSLVRSQTPVVVIDRRIPLPDVDMVLVDSFTGAKQAVDYLIRLGHHNIGFIGGMEHLSVMQHRQQGYLAALQMAGLPVCETYIHHGNNRQDGGYTAMTQMLAMANPPSAVLIANNLMTLGGLQAVHEAGRQVPEQLSLVGFDDMDWAPSLRPPLTVVAQPAYEMGENAASRLLARIHDPSLPPEIVVLDTRLIIRASCFDFTQERLA